MFVYMDLGITGFKVNKECLLHKAMNREALYSAKPSAGIHAHHMLRHVYSVCKAAEDQEARMLMKLHH